MAQTFFMFSFINVCLPLNYTYVHTCEYVLVHEFPPRRKNWMESGPKLAVYGSWIE